MKRLSLIVLALLLLMVSCKKESLPEEQAGSDDETKNRCMITLIQGEVSFLDGEGNSVSKDVGDLLDEKDSVLTGSSSQVELQIGERANVRIKADSKVMLAALLLDGELENTKLKLFQGHIMAESDKLSGGSLFKVETDSVTVGVRGTQFGVVNVEGLAKVLVREGRVAVVKNYEEEILGMLDEAASEVAQVVKEEILTELLLAAGEKYEIDEESYKEEERAVTEGVERIVGLKTADEARVELGGLKEILKEKEAEKEPLTDEEREDYLDDEDFESMEPEEDIFEKKKTLIKLRLLERDGVPVMITYNDRFFSFAYDELEFLIDRGEEVTIGVNSQFHLPELIEITAEEHGESDAVLFEVTLRDDPEATAEEKEKSEKEIKEEFKELTSEVEEKVEELEKLIDKKDDGADKMKEEVKAKTEDELEELERELSKDETTDVESDLDNLMDDIKDKL